MSLENTADFFLEIGAEELPAAQISAISNHIKNGILAALAEAEIETAELEAHYTPRRLFFYLPGLDAIAKDREEIIKGPPEKIAKAEDGGFSQAALGFAKKNQIAEADLYFEDGYLYCKKQVKAQEASAVLAAALPEIIASTPGTRFMRWASNDLKFARPIQWLTALMLNSKGTQVLDFELAGMKPGKTSQGHRFLGSDEFEVESREQYEAELEKQGVYLDAAKRREKIIQDSEALAKSIGGEVVLDDSLLDEVIMITENPSPILCDFDEKFLEIPDCVLKTVMIHHQRYIPVAADGKLMAKFIAVSNNPLEGARENIKLGNQKVIVPRFKDAEFFVQEDQKQSLEQRLEQLERLNSLKGNLLQKSERHQQIVEYLMQELNEASDKDLVLQAAKLAKADLNTNLVFEFTELQGEVGGVYARKQGLDELIAKAIEDHYKPRFAGDDLPETLGGKLIAVADKLDNIVAAFALGKIPSGSADPFALRRQANGMLEIILHSHMVLDVEALVRFVCKLQEAEFGQGEMLTKIKGRGQKRKEIQVAELSWDGTDDKVIEFLESRLEFVFEICHKDTGVNKAVLAPAKPLAEIDKRHQMVHLLYDLKAEDGFGDLVEAVTRVSNIADKQEESKVDPAVFELDYEKEFFQVVESLAGKLESEALLQSVKPINNFFDNVLVNAEDEKLKTNRKALVAYADSVFGQIGDFTLL